MYLYSFKNTRPNRGYRWRLWRKNWTSLQDYLKGKGNPRSDTIDLIAGKIGIPLPGMFSEPSHSYERAVRMLQAAEMLGGLPEAQQEQAVQLFLARVSLFT